jgi:hypothetical protein
MRQVPVDAEKASQSIKNHLVTVSETCHPERSEGSPEANSEQDSEDPSLRSGSE